MKNKPFIFILLAVLHIVEPIIKILYFKIHTHFPLMTILSNTFNISEFRSFFDFWFLFPIAGFALLGMKKWSYPLFLSMQFYSVYTHLTYEPYTWPYVSKIPHLSSIALLVFNIAVILYFLLPEVRRPFFDQSLKWWERKTRYTFTLPCSLSFDDPNILYDCNILNVSQTGCFVRVDNENLGQIKINNGAKIKVHISYKNNNISVEGDIMSIRIFENMKGLGIKFHYQNMWDKLHMRRLLSKVSKSVDKQENSINKIDDINAA